MKEYERKNLEAKQDAVRPQIMMALVVIMLGLIVTALFSVRKEKSQLPPAEMLVERVIPAARQVPQAEKPVAEEKGFLVIDKGASFVHASVSISNQSPVPPENPYLKK